MGNGTCPPPTAAAAPGRVALSAASAADGIVVKSPWRENRILRR
jgi:hypothetical protein